MTDIHALVRQNILNLKPYSSARSEFDGDGQIWLDANENPYGNGLNRYPDPLQLEVKYPLADLLGISPANLFIGNGSDEAIDLIIRIFCQPGKDRVAILSPTYGMYKVSADINEAEVIDIPLNEDFDIDFENTRQIIAQTTPKLLFICSPNNPTGNELDPEKIELLADAYQGIVVIDQAYAEFSKRALSLHKFLESHDNVIFLRTFSKSWGLAGIRAGIAISSPAIIDLLNKVKPPYNVNTLSQEVILNAIENHKAIMRRKDKLVEHLGYLKEGLKKLGVVKRIYPSDSNFILVQFDNAKRVYDILAESGIVVRDRSAMVEGCLRITVGTPDENDILIQTLKEIS